MTLQVLDTDIVNNILFSYDFDTTRSLKFKNTRLEQRYHEKTAIDQLANLIYFLAENKYISSEKKATLIKKIHDANLAPTTI